MPGSVARPWAPELARHGITASSQARAVASVLEARRDLVRRATNVDAYGCRAPCCGRPWQRQRTTDERNGMSTTSINVHAPKVGSVDLSAMMPVEESSKRLI